MFYQKNLNQWEILEEIPWTFQKKYFEVYKLFCEDISGVITEKQVFFVIFFVYDSEVVQLQNEMRYL